MIFRHGNRIIPPLPEVPGAVQAQIEHPGVLALNALQQPGKRALPVRNQNQMDVIWHQAVGLNGNPVVVRKFREQIQVEKAISLTKKDLLAIVTPLGDVVRDARNHNSIRTWHNLLCRSAPELLTPIGGRGV